MERQKLLINQQVYACIKTKIINDELKPGQKLSIEKLSRELGVSRMPVTTALTNLQRDGYVIMVPQSGTFVRELSEGELELIYKSRAVLERLVLEGYGDRVRLEPLALYRQELERFSGREAYGPPELEQLFELDVRMHHTLMEASYEIIGQNIYNITDLTKRSRRLSLKHTMEVREHHQVERDNIGAHIEIIDRIQKGAYAAAAELVYMDIMRTWQNVKRLLY